MYWSVHVAAPLGQTTPIFVQAILSVEVRISIPGAVPVVEMSQSRFNRGGLRLTENKVFSRVVLAHS